MVDSKLNIPVNFKGSQPQIQRIKKQDEDDHWISEEELYTEGSSDEEKPSHSSRKHNLKGRKSETKRRHYSPAYNRQCKGNEKYKESDNSDGNENSSNQCDISWRPKRGSIKLPGLTREEILLKHSDLLDMKKALRELEEKLSGSDLVGKICNFGNDRDDAMESIQDEKIAERSSEMKELDKVLKQKTEEIKMVKLERMSVAEESKKVLQELSKSDTSEAVKTNSEQFLKLLQYEVNDSPGDNFDTSKAVKPSRMDKIRIEDSGKKSDTFIERNIKLAKCGDGVLSLTDEEKFRLKIVLKDIDDENKGGDRPAGDEVHILADNHYVLNEETKKILEDIDRKLEEHEKTKFPFQSIRSSEMKSEATKDNGENEEGSKSKKDIHKKTGNECKRLKELDKLLKILTSASDEAIDPLLHEDLQYLIEESKQSLSLSEQDNNHKNPEMPSKEEITHLVTVAKSIMPHFKFRCE